MKGSELITKYIEFFKRKKHVEIPSAPLVPLNDASVLFNTAGMQPLVPFLTGKKHPSGTRLVDIQKCIRTVDFENIGDKTHHTFFFMLGNWSLGDYFKKEAITWSHEFLTSKDWLGLSMANLAVTVYQGDSSVPRDEESAGYWKECGFTSERIAYVGKDNFWIAGETGPCGPCTEMFFWTGENKAPAIFDVTDERWVEIWNDVFMAYTKLEDGSVQPLAAKNVDTGMGLERTLAVLNGTPSNYETDLFLRIIQKIEELSGKKYLFEKGDLGLQKAPTTWRKNARAMRVIADHLRASVFILADGTGIVPSNVERGYVLRRMIRRAIRYGKQLGMNMFLGNLATVVIDMYKEIWPELEEHSEHILNELMLEEEKFELTLEKGLREFEKMAAFGRIDGTGAFLLFQSYGFPLEMTEELADELKISVDTEGFFKEFEEHQEKSRAGADKKFAGGLADLSPETIKLHTATHLLNEALRRVIGEGVKQRGSNITPERLRFDFNFDRKLTDEEKQNVEDEVNRVINLGLAVERKEMKKEEAVALGAEMEFGAKYPDVVSVYFVGDYSKEFCGGPHVKNSKDIGHFHIVKEQSIAAGVRRIKAVVKEMAH